MRTYSFDHFKADKPEPSVANPGGAEQTPPAEQAKPPVHDEGQIHYGRQHGRTAELYHQRRLEREQAERMGATSVQQEPMGGEAPPVEAAKPEVEQAQSFEQPKEPEREQLQGLARQAVATVIQAARDAAKGHPLQSAKKLAGDTLSGVRRVAQEVSARRANARSKGTGKKR